MPHNIRLLRFTKGMDALPLRHQGMASPDPKSLTESERSNIDRFNSFPTEICEME